VPKSGVERRDVHAGVFLDRRGTKTARMSFPRYKVTKGRQRLIEKLGVALVELASLKKLGKKLAI